MYSKLLITFICLIVTSSTINSQNRQRGNTPAPPPINERVDNLLDILTKNLELNEEQVKKSDKIFTKYFKSLESIRKSGTRPDRNKITSITKKRDKDFEATLTEAQKLKYQDLKKVLYQRRNPNN